MSTNPYAHGHGHTSTLLSTSLVEADIHTGFVYELEEQVQIKGFSVTYDRKFNLGNFELLAPAITIWVKSRVPEGAALDLHHAKERIRRMARENVRAQFQRVRGNDEVVFLGLQPPAGGGEDPIFIRTLSVTLLYRANLGDDQSIMPGYTDWADVQHVAHSPGELHIALARMWQSLWANVKDEISRARGNSSTGAFFGLPSVEVEDLTAALQPNGHFARRNAAEPLSTGRASAANNGSR